MRWPLTMSGRTVIASVANPGPISTISMPSPLEASSSAHIALAQARATSSGDKAALTFTRFSRPIVWTRCSAAWLKLSNVVVIDHDPLRRSLGLRGQTKASLQLPGFQRVVDVQRRLALHQFGTAGRAHAALAGEGQIDSGAQCGMKDRLVLGDRHVAALAVDDQRRDRFRRRVRRNDLLRPRLAAELRYEALDVDALVRDAEPSAGRLDVLAHAGRTADEDVVDAFRWYQRAQQHPHLVAVEPAVQDRNVLFLAGDDVEDREPVDEAILELFERLEEHNVVGRAIAVEQEEAAVGFAREDALDDRQDRRDAGPSGKADMDAAA